VTERPEDFRKTYASAFDAYLADKSEQGLHDAYELGREAVARGLSVLDIAAIHHACLAASLVDIRESAQRRLEGAENFLLQTLSAFEMVQRGFQEAQEAVLLEKQHASQMHELAAAGLAINSGSTIREVLQTVADKGRAIVGAHWCVAAVCESGDGPVKVWAISCSEGHDVPDVFLPPEVDVEALGLHAFRAPRVLGETPAPVVFEHISAEEVSSSGAWLIAPILGGDQSVAGFISLGDGGEGGFSEKHESILVQLGQMASVAIDNRRLYEREHRVAQTLQQGLLPQQLPSIAGLVAASRYVPGAAGVNVGGDWFDVVALPHGRTGIAIGDVVGRGVTAASMMGQVRTAFRAYALDGGSPESVVSRLNQLLPTLDVDHFSTIVYVVWDPSEAAAHVLSAGHPPPLLLERGGKRRYLYESLSIALGVASDPPYEAAYVSIGAGASLFLYTDGLIEQDGDLELGLARLAQAVGEPWGDLGEVCERVLDRMIPAERKDDAALLAVRFC
jgi:hypothetical protein